jgi:hypothetical protein
VLHKIKGGQQNGHNNMGVEPVFIFFKGAAETIILVVEKIYCRKNLIGNVHELEIQAQSMMGKRVLTLFWLL